MKMITLLAAVTALALTGCSQPINTGSPAPVQTSSAAPAPSEAESGPPSDLDCNTADEETFQKWCAAEPGDGTEIEPAPAGQPFDYVDIPGDDTEPALWKVTLDKLNCGLMSIPEADGNPEWDGGNDKPQYVAAKPDEGNEFCVAYWSWKNVGKVPTSTDFAGDIVLGEDERFAASSEDQTRAWTVMDTELGVDYSKQINPRGSAKSMDIYQIPAGEKPTAIWFPGDTMYSESYVLVSAP